MTAGDRLDRSLLLTLLLTELASSNEPVIVAVEPVDRSDRRASRAFAAASAAVHSATSVRIAAGADVMALTSPTEVPAYSAAPCTSPVKLRVGGTGDRRSGGSSTASAAVRRTR
ncbi:MAG: hypothetical protein ACLGIZ_17260 [Acidimicrobiia bacterium]